MVSGEGGTRDMYNGNPVKEVVPNRVKAFDTPVTNFKKLTCEGQCVHQWILTEKSCLEACDLGLDVAWVAPSQLWLSRVLSHMTC